VVHAEKPRRITVTATLKELKIDPTVT